MRTHELTGHETRVSTMVDETKHACEECGKLCLAYLSNLKTIRGK